MIEEIKIEKPDITNFTNFTRRSPTLESHKGQQSSVHSIMYYHTPQIDSTQVSIMQYPYLKLLTYYI